MAHAALELCLTLVLGPVLGTICVRNQHNEHGGQMDPRVPEEDEEGAEWGAGERGQLCTKHLCSCPGVLLA